MNRQWQQLQGHQAVVTGADAKPQQQEERQDHCLVQDHCLLAVKVDMQEAFLSGVIPGGSG
jgi:hypothetical protein